MQDLVLWEHRGKRDILIKRSEKAHGGGDF